MAEIKKLVQSLTEQVASLKSQPACQCECPSIDEIRQVVREELDRVTVTLKTVSGETKKVEMPLTTKAKAQVKELQPGDVVVAINGEPVTPYTYQSQVFNAPITQYSSPRFEMRVLNGVYGAVRQNAQTCRMVNGVKGCN